MKLTNFAIAVLASATLASAALGQTVITVVPASAPNVFGSPSYGGWEANALVALENNLPVAGGSRLTTPTAYEASGPVLLGSDNVVTGFPSWRGQADPAAPFNNELGNRLQFGLKIISPLSTFQFADVSSTGTSTGAILDYSFPDAAGLTFAQLGAVGINYGTDGIKGTPDDARFTGSEPTETLINELYYVGDGSALAPDGGPFTTTAARQQAIQGQIDVYGGSQPFFFTGSYSVNGFTGSSTVAITPEPTTLAALAGAGAILGRRRRA